MMYSEQTPNPESLKFVTNKMLYHGVADLNDRVFAEQWSPLATVLYQLPSVKAVYLSNNFVTVTKEGDHQWDDIMPEIKAVIKQHLENELPVVTEGMDEALQALKTSVHSNYSNEEQAIVEKIRNLIDQNVKPAVEMDGGHIEFIRYDEGKVYVSMHGSCSGCPSSTVTLKAGIEGLLKRMVPEVTEVIQEMM